MLTLRERFAHLFQSQEMAGIVEDPDETVIPAFKSGGQVIGDGNDPADGKRGGYFQGRKHSQGGIKAINVSTDTPIEVEGEEVIITAPAVKDTRKRMFQGKMMTNREILSAINQSGGGVSFADGGEIDRVNCRGDKYDLGGQLMEDWMVVRQLQSDMDSDRISPLYRDFTGYFSKRKK
jgi:hypothetical protein